MISEASRTLRRSIRSIENKIERLRAVRITRQSDEPPTSEDVEDGRVTLASLDARPRTFLIKMSRSVSLYGMGSITTHLVDFGRGRSFAAEYKTFSSCVKSRASPGKRRLFVLDWPGPMAFLKLAALLITVPPV
jgi:hypothetical protein